MVVGLHMLAMSTMYWFWRDFPFADEPMPVWERYAYDAFYVLAGVGGMLLFVQRRGGKWIGVGFYSIVLTTQVYRLMSLAFHGAFSESYGVSFFFERLVMLILLAGPIVLLPGLQSQNSHRFSPPNNRPAPDRPPGGR
jgi:hypothetical protein